MNRQKVLITIAFVLAATVLVWVFYVFFLVEEDTSPRVEIVDSKQNKEITSFVVDIADEPEEWQRGLQFVSELPQDKGMLFIFDDETPRTFWMKSVEIPLDIIFFSSSKEIVAYYKSLPPCEQEQCDLYPSNKPTKYVLEVNGGLVDQYNIKQGDKITLQNIEEEQSGL